MKKLRDGWNFHNDIAMSLEFTGCHVFGIKGIREKYNTCFSADKIEGFGYFFPAMQSILLHLVKYKINDDIDGFIELCNKYPNANKQHYTEEEKTICNHIYMKFDKLYEKFK